jgi:hypothetical protein
VDPEISFEGAKLNTVGARIEAPTGVGCGEGVPWAGV